MKSKSISDILNDVQKTFACHKKCLKVLRSIQAEDSQKFVEEFFPLLNRALIVFKREAPVERIIQFVINFATSSEEGSRNDEFAMFLLNYLMEYTSAKDKGVRFRSSQLIAGLVNSLPEDAEIEDELWTKLSEKMSYRTKDKVPIIRCQAVAALFRLQNPKEAEDPVIQEYIRLLSTDSSAEVRKSVLNYIAVTRYTLIEIITRTRDVNEEVRCHAYIALGKKVPIKALSISQRTSLLKDGLSDRSTKVQDACIALLCEYWLPSLEHNVITLLSKLDVEEFEEVSILVLEKIFSKILKDETKLALTKIGTTVFGSESVSEEAALYWRVYCKHLKEQQPPQYETIERTFPEISVFCETIKKYQNKPFILKQLVILSTFLDHSDEVGRRNLSLLLRDMSSISISEESVKTILQSLYIIQTSEEEFIRITLEILSDVRDPEDDPETSDEVDASPQAEPVDPAITLRCLTITSQLLEVTIYDTTDPQISGLKDLIIAAIQHVDTSIRRVAFYTLGLYSILIPSTSTGRGKKQYFSLFENAITRDHESVKIVAAKALFDILISSGEAIKRLGEPTVEDEAPKLIEIMMKLINSQVFELQSTIIEGFAKLAIREIYCPTELLSNFLLIFFTPEEDSEDSEEESEESSDERSSVSIHQSRIKQCLSIFFPAFSFSKSQRQTQIAHALAPALEEIASSKNGSATSLIPPANVAKFVLYLTSRSNLQVDTTKAAKEIEEDRENLHGIVGIAMMKMMNKHVRIAKPMVKILASLDLQGEKEDNIKVLRRLTRSLSKRLADKTSGKMLDKFSGILVGLDPSLATLEVEEEKEEEEKPKKKTRAAKKPIPRLTRKKQPVRRRKEESSEEEEEEELSDIVDSSDEEDEPIVMPDSPIRRDKADSAPQSPSAESPTSDSSPVASPVQAETTSMPITPSESNRLSTSSVESVESVESSRLSTSSVESVGSVESNRLSTSSVEDSTSTRSSTSSKTSRSSSVRPRASLYAATASSLSKKSTKVQVKPMASRKADQGDQPPKKTSKTTSRVSVASKPIRKPLKEITSTSKSNSNVKEPISRLKRVDTGRSDKIEKALKDLDDELEDLGSDLQHRKQQQKNQLLSELDQDLDDL